MIKKFLFITMILFIFGVSYSVFATESPILDESEVYIFTEKNCTYCDDLKEYLSEAFPDLYKQKRDMSNSKNKDLFDACANKFSIMNGKLPLIVTRAVPLICTSSSYTLGWGEKNQKAFENMIKDFYKPTYGKEELLTQLVNTPQNIGIVSGNLKQSPFMSMCANLHSSDILKKAISNGVNIDLKDKFNNSCLHYLAAYNMGAINALDLISQHSKHINTKGANGMTPLVMSVWGNQSKAFIQKLIELGAKVDSKAVWWAAVRARSDLMSLFLEKGFKLTSEDMNITYKPAKSKPLSLEELIEEVNTLDEEILKIDPKFDFTDMDIDAKNRYIDFMNNYGFISQKLDYITYENNTKNTEEYKINGKMLKNILAMNAERVTKKDLGDDIDLNNYAAIVSASDNNLYRNYYLQNGKIKADDNDYVYFQGEHESRTKTWKEPDATCQEALDNLEETKKRMANCTSVMMKENSPFSYTSDMFKTCAEMERNANKVYWEARSRIMPNCGFITKQKNYEVITNGIALYTLNGEDVLMLPVQDGKLNSKTNAVGIPYKKVMEEIVKKYGNPNDTLVSVESAHTKQHIHIFNGKDWSAFVRVDFLKNEEISLNSEVASIEQGFIKLKPFAQQMQMLLSKDNASVAAEEMQLFEELKKRKAELIALGEQERLKQEEKEKKEKEERINSFHL